MARTQPARRFTAQPARPMPVDWSNPLAAGLRFATYAGDASHFTDLVNRQPMSDPYGTDASFKVLNHTKWGRGRSTGGGGYRNATTFPASQVAGRQTVLALMRPRAAVASGGTNSYNALEAGDTGSWSLGAVGVAPGGYFKGLHANGAGVILSDAPYTIGEHYAVAYVNQSSLDEPAFQRMYVNGVKQAAEFASTSTFNKVTAFATLTATPNIDIFAAFVWDRALSESEIKAVSENPYQLFNQRPSIMRAASSAPVDPPPVTRHAVEGAASSSASASTSSATSQRHKPAGAASVSTSTSTSGQLVQRHKPAGSNSTSSSASSAGATASQEAPRLAGSPAVSASISGGGAAVQRHKLAGAGTVSESFSPGAAVSIPSDPRFARPQAEAVAGGWTPSTGDSLAAMLSEPAADASSYIQATAPSSCEIALNPVQDPGTSTGQVVRYQAWSPSGNGVTVRLKQGAAVIASWVHAQLPIEPTIYAQALTPQQCDAITNYADLRFVFEAA